MKPEFCDAVPPNTLLAARRLAIEEIVKAVPPVSDARNAATHELIVMLLREVAGAAFDAGVEFMAKSQTKEKEPR